MGRVKLRAGGSHALQSAWDAASSVFTTEGDGWTEGETIAEWVDEWRQQFGFSPSDPQVRFLEALHAAVYGYGPKVIKVWTGKQAGKTECLKFAARKFADTIKGVHGWIASNSYDHTDNIFTAVTNVLPRPAWKVLNTKPKRAEGERDAFIKTKSWGELESLEADACDFVIKEEAQNLSSQADSRMQPRVLARAGIIVEAGTPFYDSTYFLEQWDVTNQQREEFLREATEIADEDPVRAGRLRMAGAVHLMWTTEENPNHNIQAMLAQQRLTMHPDMYAERYLCRIAKPEGLVHPEFDWDTHMGNYPFDPGMPVTIIVDPGARWYSVAAAQIKGGQTFIVDGFKLTDTTDAEAIETAKHRPWWNNAHWKHIDAGLVIDVAARQRRAESSSTTLDHWWDLGQLKGRYQMVAIEDQVKLMRAHLIDPRSGRPAIFFNTSLNDLDNGAPLREFALYRYGSNGLPIPRNNHFINSVTYFLADRFGARGYEMEQDLVVGNYMRLATRRARSAARRRADERARA